MAFSITVCFSWSLLPFALKGCLFYMTCMCACVCVCVGVRAHECRCPWRSEASDPPLELESQGTVSHPIWVLGIEFKSSEREINALNH